MSEIPMLAWWLCNPGACCCPCHVQPIAILKSSASQQQTLETASRSPVHVQHVRLEGYDPQLSHSTWQAIARVDPPVPHQAASDPTDFQPIVKLKPHQVRPEVPPLWLFRVGLAAPVSYKTAMKLTKHLKQLAAGQRRASRAPRKATSQKGAQRQAGVCVQFWRAQSAEARSIEASRATLPAQRELSAACCSRLACP